jgi:ATP/ADP translocase
MTSLSRVLALSGTVPFLGCAVAPLAGFAVLPLVGDPVAAALAWSLAILSFMAGVHWGQYLAGGPTISINLFFTSVVVAIAGWLTFLLLAPQVALLIFALLFLVLLLVDRRLMKTKHIGPAYWKTRLWATLIVIGALLVTAYSAG